MGQSPAWQRRRLPDRVGPNLALLFVGINPGARSAELGHHYAGHSNRFWKLLHESGLVPQSVGYADDARLPEWGFGLTNLVSRPTTAAGDLRRADFEAGRQRLLRKVRRLRPAIVALVGVTIYRVLEPAGGRDPGGPLGLRPERLADARLFVLPNPSGRNAAYSYGEMLDAYRALRRAITARDRSSSAGGAA